MYMDGETIFGYMYLEWDERLNKYTDHSNRASIYLPHLQMDIIDAGKEVTKIAATDLRVKTMRDMIKSKSRDNKRNQEWKG